MDEIKIQDRCYIELKEYSYSNFISKFGTKLDDYLYERGLCNHRGDKIYFNFTGFVISKNEIIVVFPKAYVIPEQEDELKRHTLILAKTLLRYRQEVTLEEEEKELLGSPDCVRPYGISAALTLIKDYEEFGYIRREKTKKNSITGNNYDWPSIIKTKAPFISRGIPVYLELITRHSAYDNSNIICRLHRYAVQKSYEKYGWILGKVNYEVDPEFSEIPCEVSLAAHLLNKELETTNKDREIRLIKALLEFIIGCGDNDNRVEIETIATPYFYTTWEAICGYIFNNDYILYKDDIPKPTWHIGSAKESTKQIPDIIFKNNNTLYILDAKYYDIEINRPGWHDLVKQFFYYYSLKTKFDNNIKNALIFPGKNEGLITYIGYIDFEQYPLLGKVDAIRINTYEAMKCYGYYLKGDYYIQLLDLINNTVTGKEL